MSPNPNQIRLTAMTIRGLAGALPPEADHLITLSGPLTWEGPAADASQARVRQVRVSINSVVAMIRELADRLDRQADEIEAWMRAEAEAKAIQAEEVEAWMRGHAAVEAEAARLAELEREPLYREAQLAAQRRAMEPRVEVDICTVLPDMGPCR